MLRNQRQISFNNKFILLVNYSATFLLGKSHFLPRNTQMQYKIPKCFSIAFMCAQTVYAARSSKNEIGFENTGAFSFTTRKVLESVDFDAVIVKAK